MFIALARPNPFVYSASLYVTLLRKGLLLVFHASLYISSDLTLNRMIHLQKRKQGTLLIFFMQVSNGVMAVRVELSDAALGEGAAGKISRMTAGEIMEVNLSFLTLNTVLNNFL